MANLLRAGVGDGHVFRRRCEFARYMLGDALADDLGIAPQPPSWTVFGARLYLWALGALARIPLAGDALEALNRWSMRCVRYLHDRRGPRHGVAATVDAPVATCPYRPGVGAGACPHRAPGG